MKKSIPIILGSVLLVGCMSNESNLVEPDQVAVYAEYVDYGEDYLLRIEDTSTWDFGYVNLEEDTIIPIQYIVAYTDTMRNYSIVLDSSRGLVGINREAEVLYEIFGYDNGPDYVVDGLFRIEQHGLIGFANQAGKIIIEPKYLCAWPFENGLAKVSYNCEWISDGEHTSWGEGDWFYIDKNGEEAFPEQTDIVKDFFIVADSFFSKGSWYMEDKNGVETLLKEGIEEKDYGWHLDFLSNNENYLGISTFLSNTNCYVAFRTFKMGETKMAFLYESDKNKTDLMLLSFDETKDKWVDKEMLLPEVNNEDFFDNLNEEENALVKDEGYFRVGMSNTAVMFYFDLRRLQSNISDYDTDFSKSHDFEFELKWNNDKFWLDQHEKSFDSLTVGSY